MTSEENSVTERSEADLMAEVDRNPKAHEDSTPEETARLEAMYGAPDESGLFRPAPDASGQEETAG